MKDAKFPPMMTALSDQQVPYPYPDRVKCFHVQAGQPCTRYLEGSTGEREAIVAYLRRFTGDANVAYVADCIERQEHYRPAPTGSADR